MHRQLREETAVNPQWTFREILHRLGQYESMLGSWDEDWSLAGLGGCTPLGAALDPILGFPNNTRKESILTASL